MGLMLFTILSDGGRRMWHDGGHKSGSCYFLVQLVFVFYVRRRHHLPSSLIFGMGVTPQERDRVRVVPPVEEGGEKVGL